MRAEPLIKLMMGDCLERLRELPSGSISHVVTDPPYGQSNESYDRGVDPAVWRECHRVTGPDAALVSFAGGPTYHRIASDIEAAGWKVRQMWGWIYRDGMITSAWPKEGFDRLAPAMDPICYATKGKVLLNLEREGEGDWHRLKADGTPRGRGAANYSERHSNHGAVQATGHWPKSIMSDGVEPFEYFDFRRTRPESYRSGHPNQKPLALMESVVRKLPRMAGRVCLDCGGKGRPGWPESAVATFCLDCDGKGRLPSPPTTILDPFMGSATTLIAASECGFDAIGIERDPAYFAIAESRIAAARSALPLLAPAT